MFQKSRKTSFIFCILNKITLFLGYISNNLIFIDENNPKFFNHILSNAIIYKH